MLTLSLSNNSNNALTLSHLL